MTLSCHCIAFHFANLRHTQSMLGAGSLHVEALIRVQQGSLSDLLLIIDSILSIYL